MNYNCSCSSIASLRYVPCCATGMLLMHGYVMFRLFQAPVCIMLYRVAAVPLLLGVARDVCSTIVVYTLQLQ